MFSSSKWIFRVINTQIVTIITIISLFLLLCLFQDLLFSSSCNTDMATLTISTNPVAINPKTKREKLCFHQLLSSINPFFTHPPWRFFHSPRFPSAHSFIMHTFIFSSYPFTSLNVPTTPSLTLSFTLPYHTRSVSPISLHL